ncbi:KAT8 regulatory NSL complex subunit 2 [Chamberlinius hualienensis]
MNAFHPRKTADTVRMVNRGKSASVKKSKSNAQPSIEGILCSYPHRVCTRNRLDGYEYCCKHILEDKTAPYRQCNYVYPKNGRKCANVTSKLERRDGFCMEHSRKNAQLRQNAFRKRKPPETVASLVDELDHYNVLGENSSHEEGLPNEFCTSLLARLPLTSPVSRISKIIEYASDSDSEVDVLSVDQTYRGVVESDAESIDSEHEESSLRHAGVYTVEEATQIARDKLIRLQSLYIAQFKRLQHVLQEKRRKYLHNLKLEKETFGNCVSFPRSTPKEEYHYRKLKSLLNYHKLNGVDTLLRVQEKEKRKALTQGVHYTLPSASKCFYSCDGEKCAANALPFSKFCFKHVLKDSKQVLYRQCTRQDPECTNPITFGLNMKTCALHAELPAMPSLDLPPPPPPPVKTEDELKMETQTTEILDTIQDENSTILNPEKPDNEMFIPPNQLWEPSGSDSKLRQVLESINMTPGELPPEELLDTS